MERKEFEESLRKVFELAEMASKLLAFARRVRDNGHAHSPVIHGWAVELLKEFDE